MKRYLPWLYVFILSIPFAFAAFLAIDMNNFFVLGLAIFHFVVGICSLISILQKPIFGYFHLATALICLIIYNFFLLEFEIYNIPYLVSLLISLAVFIVAIPYCIIPWAQQQIPIFRQILQSAGNRSIAKEIKQNIKNRYIDYIFGFISGVFSSLVVYFLTRIFEK